MAKDNHLAKQSKETFRNKAQVSCLHRVQARDTEAFPLPLASSLSLGFLPPFIGLGMLGGCSLQGCGGLDLTRH